MADRWPLAAGQTTSPTASGVLPPSRQNMRNNFGAELDPLHKLVRRPELCCDAVLAKSWLAPVSQNNNCGVLRPCRAVSQPHATGPSSLSGA